ncbi:hypothetical protein BV25DRAFT_1836668 [Artomyces pyxidatus]|uniref:Uncharacterized protein n=1 Tax=Artomyces pyxidatus TaxID=48021 RepID=A0ACB8T8G9_9AGAM|nr:hypothetical protein BV25DRAFT_1836668 [Artomyces pyxidatus]
MSSSHPYRLLYTHYARIPLRTTPRSKSFDFQYGQTTPRIPARPARDLPATLRDFDATDVHDACSHCSQPHHHVPLTPRYPEASHSVSTSPVSSTSALTPPETSYTNVRVVTFIESNPMAMSGEGLIPGNGNLIPYPKPAKTSTPPVVAAAQPPHEDGGQLFRRRLWRHQRYIKEPTQRDSEDAKKLVTRLVEDWYRPVHEWKEHVVLSSSVALQFD